MLEGAGEVALFGLGVKFRFVGLMGGDDGVDDPRQLVCDGDQGGGTTELGAHAAVKVTMNPSFPHHLRYLNLGYMAEHYEAMAAQAAEKSWSPLELPAVAGRR